MQQSAQGDGAQTCTKPNHNTSLIKAELLGRAWVEASRVHNACHGKFDLRFSSNKYCITLMCLLHRVAPVKCSENGAQEIIITEMTSTNNCYRDEIYR